MVSWWITYNNSWFMSLSATRMTFGDFTDHHILVDEVEPDISHLTSKNREGIRRKMIIQTLELELSRSI